MNPSAHRRRWAGWLLGPPGPARAPVVQTLISLLLHLTYCGAHALAASQGLVRMETASWLMLLYLGQSLVFYGLVRSGLSRRISSDPALTSAQMAAAMVTLVLTYISMDDGRGALVSMPLLMLMFGAFGLSPRKSVLMGATALGCMALAMGWMAWHAPTPHVRGLEAYHFVIAAINMGAATALAMRLSRLVHHLRRQKQELNAALVQIQAMATRDELTGLANRRHLHEVLALEVERAHRQSTPFCVGLMDLDHFKRINDQYGHAVGDRVLRSFAELARSNARVLDVLGRWGGEEFLIIMTNRSLREALPVMERVRHNVSAASVGGLPAGAVTVSVGLVQFKPGEAVTLTLERADRCLYAAKAAGRNRVQLPEEPGRMAPHRAPEAPAQNQATDRAATTH